MSNGGSKTLLSFFRSLKFKGLISNINLVEGLLDSGQCNLSVPPLRTLVDINLNNMYWSLDLFM